MKKIILVDGSPELTHIYRKVFSKTGFDVEVALRVDQMLEELRLIRTGESKKPDLVLLDFILPDGHGMEILKAIKKSYHTKDIPVFALTNYQSPHLDKELERIGITPEEYIIKADYTPGQVVDIINSHFAAGRPKTRLA